MYPSGNRFKIVDAEPVWKIIPVPTNHVKGVCGVDDFMNHSFFFGFNHEVAFLVVRFEFGGQFKIAFTKRRML